MYINPVSMLESLDEAVYELSNAERMWKKNPDQAMSNHRRGATIYNAVQYITCMRGISLDKMHRAYRKWNESVGYQKTIPVDVAERLVQYCRATRF